MSEHNSQTNDLAKLFCRVNLALSDPWHFGMPHTLLDQNIMIPHSQVPGFLDQARRLLSAGANPNVHIQVFQYEGRRFHQLVRGPPDPKAEFLEGYIDYFSSKSHMESVTTSFREPLIDAAYAKDVMTVELLVQHGARIWKFSPGLHNPYLPAVTENNHILLNILLEATDSTDKQIVLWLEECMPRALEIAARPSSGFDIVLALMCRGVKNPLSFLPEYIPEAILDYAIHHNIALPKSQKDEPEILAAAFLGHLDLCRLVVQNGADIKACDKKRLSALHVAVGDKTTDVCKFLINSGADVCARDSHNMTPLLEAVYYGHTDAIRLLLKIGADPNDFAHMDSNTSLEDSRNQNCSCLQGAWRKGRDVAVERFAMEQWSAVHIAAYRGLTSIIRLLVEHGADMNVKNPMRWTALDIAIKNSNSTTAYWLLVQGCPFAATDEAASKLLAQAMEECNSAVVQKLLEEGVYLPAGGSLRGGYFGGLTGDVEVAPLVTDSGVGVLSSPQSIVSGQPAASICGNCSFALKSTRVNLFSSNQILGCNLCHLLQDCASIIHTNTMDIKYVNEIGAPDRELLIEASGHRFLHPTRIISYEWHELLDSLEGLEDGNTGSSAAISMARHWLHTCTKSHSQCNHRIASLYSPTRVLDLAELDSGQDPKLLQHVKLESSFAALSHRWGLEGLPSTTSHNLAHRLDRLPLEDLSQTMRDAIDVVRKLGLRYLWIDALCIIQDSTEDWLREASRMSDVFSGAIVTIAVADADHHAQGIFRARQARCIRPFPIPYLQSMPYRERTQITGEGEMYAFPKHRLLGSGNRAKGTLDSRAWILQEQLLSPRILYFGNGEIFWDCITVSASESSPISASLLHDSDPDETWALKLLRKALANSTERMDLRKRVAEIWTQVIKNYSARNLTRSSDKLIALQGVLKPLAVILREEPMAGMWKDQFWRQMIWWVAKPTSSSEDSYLAPTWSWLSAQGPVYYHNSTRTEDSLQEPGAHKFTDLELLAKVVSVDTETEPGATGIRGKLTVSGPSFSYNLKPNDFKKKVFKSWNAAKLNLNLGKWLLDDALDLPRTIQCIIIAEDSVAKMLVVLCLVPVEHLDGCWKRVGVCHWDGLAWQVSKYAGSKPEERTFVVV